MKTIFYISIGLLFGVVFTSTFFTLRDEIEFKRNKGSFWKSPDRGAVKQSALELLETSMGRTEVLSALTYRQDGEPVRVATLLGTIDAIKESKICDSFLYSLCCAANDTNEEVRLNSIEALDSIMYYLYKRDIAGIVLRRLSDENDEEVLLKKIKLLSTYLFLEYKDLKYVYENEGLEMIIPNLHEQLDHIENK